MNKQKYIDDIQEIRKIMDRSTRFISLSGISGVLSGFFALIAAYLAYETVYSGQNYMEFRKADLSIESLFQLVIIGSICIVLSVATGIYFTTRKARRNNQSIFDHQAKQMLLSLFIPLATGGLLCLILLFKGAVALVAPLTLIFYGLALINASKYATQSMMTLGLVEIMIGLAATWWLGYGLLFWALGFGVMHIIYGIAIYIKDKA